MTPQQAIDQLEQLARGSKDAMKRGELAVANTIALTAIALAPENTEQLIESINIEQDANGTSVEVLAPYAAYVEFGTGPFAKEYVATLPREWQEEALRFFVSGEGKTQAHPFLYPAIQQHLPELESEIAKELAKLAE